MHKLYKLPERPVRNVLKERTAQKQQEENKYTKSKGQNPIFWGVKSFFFGGTPIFLGGGMIFCFFLFCIFGCHPVMSVCKLSSCRYTTLKLSHSGDRHCFTKLQSRFPLNTTLTTTGILSTVNSYKIHRISPRNYHLQKVKVESSYPSISFRQFTFPICSMVLVYLNHKTGCFLEHMLVNILAPWSIWVITCYNYNYTIT